MSTKPITVASIYTRNSQSNSNNSFAEVQDLVSNLQAKIASLQAYIESSAESNVSHPYNKPFG